VADGMGFTDPPVLTVTTLHLLSGATASTPWAQRSTGRFCARRSNSPFMRTQRAAPVHNERPTPLASHFCHSDPNGAGGAFWAQGLHWKSSDLISERSRRYARAFAASRAGIACGAVRQLPTLNAWNYTDLQPVANG